MICQFRNVYLCDNVGNDILCDIVIILCMLSSYHSVLCEVCDIICGNVVFINVLYVYACSEPK